MIQLDGSNGGGQILRTALSLSMVTGQPFHLKNIRGKRPKPGLMRQHLTCVKAAAEICDGSIDGAELLSREVIFNPGKICSGDYHFKIGTAGSTTLLAQTLLPALWMAEGKSTLRLEGGTHNPMAPPADFIARVFLPVVEKMGFTASCELVRHGFAPAGGGEIFLTIEPSKERQTLDLCERGEFISQGVISTIAHIDEKVAKNEITTALKELNWPDSCASIIQADESSGPGNCCAIELIHEHARERITNFGAHNRSASDVAKKAAQQMRGYLTTGAVVGRGLADQLLLPMALAGGGKFVSMNASNHFATNLEVIRKFLPVNLTQEPADQRSHYYTMTVA